jgi:hypothetical protein
MKYISPIGLSFILGYNIIEEFINPYGFEKHGYSAIVFCIIPITFVFVIVVMAIIPCGTFSMEDVRGTIRRFKDRFKEKPEPTSMSIEEMNGKEEDGTEKKSMENDHFEDPSVHFDGIHEEYEKRIRESVPKLEE